MHLENLENEKINFMPGIVLRKKSNENILKIPGSFLKISFYCPGKC